MVNLLDIPREVTWRILGFLGNQLRFEHEEGIRDLYIHHSFAAAYIRLGFELPLPVALLLSNRQLYYESVEFVFSTSPLRVDVAEHNAFQGTYEHYDLQEGSNASYVPENWTMLTSRLMPDREVRQSKELTVYASGKRTVTQVEPLMHVQHILQHPFIDRLRCLHVNHWVVAHQSQWIVSGPPTEFAQFIRALPGLQRLVIQLDISHLDDWAYEQRRYHMISSRGASYGFLENTPVIRVVSELPSGSPITTTFIVKEATDDRSIYDHDNQPRQILKRYLTRELANRVNVGLFYQESDVLDNGRYALDARRARKYRKCRGLGILEQPAGCALEPGRIRQPIPDNGDESLYEYNSDETQLLHGSDNEFW